ncbi:MAG: four helix bundle protein [Patescibacteria group bacterium]|jgi:four helix bundle protein
MNSDDLKNRTKKFALRIIKLVSSLPNNIAGRTIGGQIFRSGTSVAANYRAACRARSKAEFISKLGIVEEETDETILWLEIIIESGLIGKDMISSLLKEANEICAIVVKSKKTAKG